MKYKTPLEQAQPDHFSGRCRSPTMALCQIEELSICLIPGGSIRYCHIKLYVVIDDVSLGTMGRHKGAKGEFVGEAHGGRITKVLFTSAGSFFSPVFHPDGSI